MPGAGTSLYPGEHMHTEASRSLRCVALVLTIAVMGVSIMPRAAGAAERSFAPAAKKHCTWKTVHGKRKKICRPAAPTASPGLFAAPSGVAVDAQGSIYVADAIRGHILELAPDGRVLATIGSPGTGQGQLVQPWGIAVDGQGNIYVVDAAGYSKHTFTDPRRRIEKFSPSGHLLWQISANAAGISLPCALALDSAGNLYVTDFGQGQVVKLAPDGKPLATIQTSDPWPCGIALDAQQNLYVTQGLTEDVARYSPSGARLGTLGTRDTIDPPFGIALDHQGNLYRVHVATQSVEKLSPTGERLFSVGRLGSAPGQFHFITDTQFLGLAVDGSGTIYVADLGNDRVQKLAPGGQVLATWQ